MKRLFGDHATKVYKEKIKNLQEINQQLQNRVDEMELLGVQRSRPESSLDMFGEIISPIMKFEKKSAQRDLETQRETMVVKTNSS